ncbi:unnamed protein product [Alopecurus aequalis]
MDSSTRRALLVVAALAVLLATTCRVADAARPVPADHVILFHGGGEAASASYYYPAVTVVEKARKTVELLMARLPAGPSPKGPGH